MAASGHARLATIADARYIAPRLRAADRAECIAATQRTPEQILPGSLLGASAAYSMVSHDGTPAGMFGVNAHPDMPHLGIVWLVATPLIEDRRNAITFLRAVPGWLDKFHDDYDALFNLADSRNALHIKWIKWAGFSLIETIPVGPDNVPFISFAKVK